MRAKVDALKIADKIFSNGRIDNPEDWNEMKIELCFELDERGIEGKERKEILDTVKTHWYK